jgi:hypothetical protein
VAATFRLHDLLLSNRRSRSLYANHRRRLTEVQRRVVDEVAASGYSLLTFDQLFSDQHWGSLQAQAAEFAEQAERNLERLRQRTGKSFLVRKYDYGQQNVLDLADAWLSVGLSPMLLGIANASLGMWSKLEYLDLWYSIPVASDAERKASQAWHRDFEDSHLLKVFLYLRDVDERTGPFEFVAGSQIGGPLEHIEPWQPTGIAVSERGSTLQELDKRVAAEVPKENLRTFTGPQGTMIFCDTTGLHRGGFAEYHPRLLATLAYTSPASLAALTKRNFAIAPRADLSRLDPAAGFAIL